jgi:hypothetical protein
MKNTIDEIWFERYLLLNKLHAQIKWLINCKKPLNQKNAILNENFDRFVLKLHHQDKQIRKIVES